MMEDSNDNYEVFRDCMSATVLAKSVRRPGNEPKKRLSRGQGSRTAGLRRSKMEEPSDTTAGGDDPAELAEFIEVLSNRLNGVDFPSLSSSSI